MSARFLIQRTLHSVLVLLGALTLVFVLVRLVPSDPVIIMAGPDASAEELAETRHALGFDRPIHIQYITYLGNVLRGDLGTSLRFQQPAIQLVLDAFPATAELALLSMALATLIGLPAGIVAALKRGSPFDSLLMAGSLLGQSVPTFWLGIVLIIIFAVMLHVLPTSGYGGVRNIILPAITLGSYMTALIARMSRSSMLDVLGSDYLRTARAKGLTENSVLTRHALRNALIPIVTVIGMETGVLLSGAVVTEAVFAWPGIGNLAVNSIAALDYSVVQAVVIVSGAVFVVINLVLDVIYVWIDPRIRY